MAYDKNLELQEIEDYKAEQGMLISDDLLEYMQDDFLPDGVSEDYEGGCVQIDGY